MGWVPLNTRLYEIFKAMLSRCENPNSKARSLDTRKGLSYWVGKGFGQLP